MSFSPARCKEQEERAVQSAALLKRHIYCYRTVMNMNLIESLQDDNQQATNVRLLGWYEEG